MPDSALSVVPVPAEQPAEQAAEGQGATPPADRTGGTAYNSFAVIRRSTLLMVDDDVTMLTAVDAFLDEVGYGKFITTANPRETLELIEKHRPDVLLLDLVMPEMSGYEVMQMIRSRREYRYLPIIVLSGKTDSASRLKALEMGATDFLQKPVDPSELQLRVRNTLAFKAYQDRLADFDPVSGLRNRRRFETDLAQVIAGQTGKPGACALLHVDIDRFKNVNDSLGYRTGDLLLNSVARRLERLSHDVEARLISAFNDTEARITVAHIAGNGFALLLAGMREPGSAERVARAVLKGFSLPFKVGEHEVFLTASIGVSLFPVDAPDATSLLKHAEMAMYQAKQRGRNTHEFFSAEFNARAAERVALEADLRRAVERGELEVYYQPKVGIITGRVVGAEALLRWIHPKHGMISPVRFIPVAEEAGLITDIGRWVLETTIQQIRTWRDNGFPLVPVSVNVSAAQFNRSAILKDVRNVLANTGVDTKLLVLEVTETLLMTDTTEAIALLHAIRSMGVRLSVDDFGTGYSSLGYLRQLPVDELKIDRSFVKGLPAEKDSLAIVRAIVAMAHALNLKVVAEGVETEGQLEVLRAVRCDEFQGYLCSKPIPQPQFTRLLEKAAARPRPNPFADASGTG